MGNVDVRIFAGILVVIGILAGLFFGGGVLLAITVGLIVVAVVIFRLLVGPPSKRAGTSGETGAFLLVVGAVACLVIPIWIVYLSRLVGR